jgi:hypothetical protein
MLSNILLIKDKERKAKERAEVAGSTRKIKKQKELVLLVRVVQRIHCLKVVEQFWTKTKKLFISN